jgi:23S rRNA (guanosine2251-2'-O)-methyltransferase
MRDKRQHPAKGHRRPAPGKGAPHAKGAAHGKSAPHAKPQAFRNAPRPERSDEHREHSPAINPRSEGGGLWLYGLHTVRAALANRGRRAKRAVLTDRAAEVIGPALLGRVRHEIANSEQVARLLPAGAVHQGAALLCEGLPKRALKDAIGATEGRRRIVLVLDQISDPHNVGAILRTAAAFGVSAVVVQDRHAPPESGALAKAASGALDIVPYIEVVNIARALEELGEMGFWRIALAGEGESPLKGAAHGGDVALVLGSEGSGIRRLVRERCDTAAFVPVDAQMESLNVSNAAAIALYEMRRG